MIALVVTAFILTLIVPFLLFPKVRGFLQQWSQNIMEPNGRTNVVLLGLTFGGCMLITVLTFVFYKLICSFWAFLYTPNVAEQLVYSRGVFSLEIPSQSPFHVYSILTLVGVILIQLGVCWFLYRMLGHFMRELNRQTRKLVFSQESQLVFAFLSMCLFVAIDIVFYVQDIPFVSQYANIILIAVAKISLLSSLICVIHVQLLGSSIYKKEIGKYISSGSAIKAKLGKPKQVLGFAYAYAFVSHIPSYLGLQFLESNVWIAIVILLVLGLFFRFGYRSFFRQILDILGRIMLLPATGNHGLLGNRKLSRKRRNIVLVIAVMLFLVSIIRMPSLLSFFFFGPLMAALSLMLGFLGLLLLLTLGFYVGFTFVNRKARGHRPKLTWTGLFKGSKIGCIGLLKALMPIFAFMGFYCLLIAAVPKGYTDLDDKYSDAILGRDGAIFHQEQNEEEFNAIPVTYDELPDYLKEILINQEDRGFIKQHSFVPNFSNWFGLSGVAIIRFVSHGGGGSNLNMQLVKNEAYHGRKVQDVQRKFYELIGAFQLSLRFSPEEIMTLYLNRVPMFGGYGHKGIYNASIEAFGLPPGHLNELQSKLLIWSLKSGNSFKLADGTRIKYRDLAPYEPHVKELLMSRFELWQKQGLLDGAALNRISHQALNLINEHEEWKMRASTGQFVIGNVQASGGIVEVGLTSSMQASMGAAHKRFKKRFHQEFELDNAQLASAAIVVDISSGKIIGHLSDGPSATDLANFNEGYAMGSVMKPLVLSTMLKMGFRENEIRLYDGRIGNPVVPNFNDKFSNRYRTLEEIVALSLNTPFNNIKQIADPHEIFRQTESDLALIGIPEDPAINLSSQSDQMLHQMNYPLGSRRMTPWNLAQAYLPIFNKGVALPLTLDQSGLVKPSGIQLYEKADCEVIKEAMAATMDYGTGSHLKALLPKGRGYYAKTGTTDDATHGWTVLTDGKTLIVSWVSYASSIGGRLELNDSTKPIPYGSGGRSAGILAAMVYHEIDQL